MRSQIILSLTQGYFYDATGPVLGIFLRSRAAKTPKPPAGAKKIIYYILCYFAEGTCERAIRKFLPNVGKPACPDCRQAGGRQGITASEGCNVSKVYAESEP